MKFGISLAQLHPSGWVELAVRADELGYESVWQSDHVAIPNVAPPTGVVDEHARLRNPTTPLLDVFTTLGFLAARTTRLRLGTFVCVAGLRHPLLVARGFATLDTLSGGRALPGFGAGSVPEEFVAFGLDPKTRGRRLDETIDACRLLWDSDGEVAHAGEFYVFDGVTIRPGPQQSPLPILIGGESKRALRRAAVRGDGWLAQEHDVHSLEPILEDLRRMEKAEGRTKPLQVTVLAPVVTRKDVERFASLGVERLIVAPWTRSRDALAGVSSFAEEVFE